MTTERADMLSNYLISDPDRAEALLAKEPEEALKEINANGFDFVIDELKEYCSAFKAAVAQGELSEGALDDVAGGVVLTTGLVLGLAACFAGGAAVGIAAGAKW